MSEICGRVCCRSSVDGGRRRSDSIDLAAGLARSPKSPGVPAADTDADLGYANGLFPRFRGANAGKKPVLSCPVINSIVVIHN